MNGTKQKENAAICLTNADMVSIRGQFLEQSVQLFFENPLPALVRIDLKILFDAIEKRYALVHEAHISMLRQHGATEDGNAISLSQDAKTYPAYQKEFAEFAAKEIDLPIKEKVRVPVAVVVMGKNVQIVTTEPAASVLEKIVEWVR